MPSKQIKIESDLHDEVKEFVNNSSRYSSYKSFYEDAVRRTLDEEKEKDTDIDEIKKKLETLMKQSET